MFVGIDVHKRFCHATVVDEEGVKLSETRFFNDLEELDRFVEDLDTNAKVVMEACSTWEHIYDYIEAKGLEVSLAHPLKTRAIAEARIKTDSIDSETLANLLRADLIPEAYVPPKAIRELRSIVRHRASLVRVRTGVKNKIHAILAKEGIRHEFSDLFGKAGIEFLEGINLRKSSRLALDNYLSIIEAINQRIRDTSVRIKSIATAMPNVKLLTTIPGISHYSALLIVSEIGDIKRFSSPKKLCSYAGLVPGTYQSGSTVRYGRITKQGSKWLRWILIQAVHKTVKNPNALQRFYQKLARKKGTKIAITATARKLLIYIYQMLTLNIAFDALEVNRA